LCRPSGNYVNVGFSGQQSVPSRLHNPTASL
jgi:hypothetical protein